MKFMSFVAVLCVVGLAATANAAVTATLVEVTGAQHTAIGAKAYQIVGTSDSAVKPNGFGVDAVNVRQEYFGGVLPTPDLTNAGFLTDTTLDTHMLFTGTAWVAFNGQDGPQDVGDTPPNSVYSSTFFGDIMSLTPGAEPGTSFPFFHFVVGAADTTWTVSGQVARPGGSATEDLVSFSYSGAGGPVPPEPATLGMLAGGLLVLMRRRSR